MKTLYVSDLDGTLLTSKECISEYSIRILNRLLSKGMNFTYATARSLKTALSATRGLNSDNPVIVYNGALVVRPSDKKIIYKVTFSEGEKKYIMSVLNTMGINPLIFGINGGSECVSWISGTENEPMQRYLSRRVGDERMRAVSDFDGLDIENTDVFYFNCMGDMELISKAYSVFSRDSRLTCLMHRETYRSDYWLEIMSKDATKAVAIEKLKNFYDCEKIVCFGDSINDIPMFEVADESYAVMNADETLKKLSTGIIGYCEEDGVAKWLDEHFKEGQT